MGRQWDERRAALDGLLWDQLGEIAGADQDHTEWASFGDSSLSAALTR
jgi:hypothetical protein